MDLSLKNLSYWGHNATQHLARGHFPQSPFAPPRPYWLRTRLGWISCPDQYSPYLWGGYYEKEVKRMIGSLRDGFFVDAGANMGKYVMLAAKNGNSVLAIEANPNVFACLRRTVKQNHMEGRVRLINAALWSETGTMTFDIDGRDTCIGHVDTEPGYRPPKERKKVVAVTFDSLLDKPPSLTLLDIEGAEPQALVGAKRLIGWKAPIIFEANDRRHFEDCVKLLPGYSITRLDERNYFASAR